MTNLLKKGDTQKSMRLYYLGFAFVVALLYDIFFWNVNQGLGFFIFVCTYVFGFITVTSITKRIHQPHAFLLLIPIFIMSFTTVLYNNELVINGVPFFVFILSCVFSLLLTLKNTQKYLFSFSKIPLLGNIDFLFKKVSLVIKDLFTWKISNDNAPAIKKIVLGIAISIPILIVFASLFAQADAVFSGLLDDLFDIETFIESPFLRLFRTGIITLLLAGFFYTLISSAHILGEKKEKVFKLDNTIVGTILFLVNALFIIFVFVQFAYLFGSAEYVYKNSLVFAEHARSGFFQLAWVIALAALMLVFFYRSTAHHGTHKLLQFLKVLLIVQVGVIGYSALHRINLYQEAYGYTVLRLYVEWFIYFAMFILAIAAGSIVIEWRFRKFFYTAMICGVVALTAVTSVNVDNMIAKENVDRFILNGKELDIEYLVSDLSIDTAPEVVRAFEAGYVYSERPAQFHSYNRNEFYKYFDDENARYRSHGPFSNDIILREVNASWMSYNMGVQRLLELWK
jgi:hypothetical protein